MRTLDLRIPTIFLDSFLRELKKIEAVFEPKDLPDGLEPFPPVPEGFGDFIYIGKGGYLPLDAKGAKFYWFHPIDRRWKYTGSFYSASHHIMCLPLDPTATIIPQSGAELDDIPF